MNTKPEFTNRCWGPVQNHFAARATALWFGVAALVLVLTDSARAQTPPASIPFTDADWGSLGSGIGGTNDNSWVEALAVSGTNLYVGGAFTNAGGMSVNNIAKWDGNTWSPLGSGVNGPVYALAASGVNLYVGGAFTNAGGVPANYIAKWDGNTWSALGSGVSGGVSGSVYALAVSGTNLYVGGCFTTAGGVPANYIAKWDGNTWSPLGLGLSSAVVRLAVSGTNLYVGGAFTRAGWAQANCIAKWDGSAWSGLGGGMTGLYDDVFVWALAVSGTNLYAGGNFTTAGGVSATNFAKWDGGAWSDLGSGSPGENQGSFYFAMAMSGTNLYVGGEFASAGGVLTNCIAKWDGSAWSDLGSGITGSGPYVSSVHALAADDAGHLFVGGEFSMAGTNAASNIALANVGAPTILMPPQSQTAETGSTVELTVDADAYLAMTYLWFLNGTNLVSCGTNDCLELTNVDSSLDGTYTVVVTNACIAVTSSPAMLNVIPVVARRPVPVVQVTGEAGGLLNVEYVNSLAPAVNDWTILGSVSLTNTSQFYFDTSMPLAPARFYRAWQSGTPSVVPSLNVAGLVPAVTLTGDVGDSLRLDYINQFGPTNAWVTLGTITLTNTSQLYFDLSALGQPARLYRIVSVP